MCLRIVNKADLDARQTAFLATRLRAPEHQFDGGPRNVWDIYQSNTLYAFVLEDSGVPVAIAEASGPPDAVNAGWWIDLKFRGKKYGNKLVDLLAVRLKEQGYTGIGDIRIVTHRSEYDTQSRSMRERFAKHFARKGLDMRRMPASSRCDAEDGHG